MMGMMLLRKGGTCVLTGMAKVSDMMVPLILPDMVSSCKTLKGVLYGGDESARGDATAVVDVRSGKPQTRRVGHPEIRAADSS